MNYMKKVEEFFWNNLEDDELQVTDDNYNILTQAIRLMEIDDESIANKEIENDSKLKSLFGFNCYETLNIIEACSTEEEESDSYSESGESLQTKSSEEEVFPENLRMNNQETPKGETGESSGIKSEENSEDKTSGSRKRKGNFYPNFSSEEKGTTTNISVTIS